MRLLNEDIEFGRTETLLALLVAVQVAVHAVTFGSDAPVYLAAMVGALAAVTFRWPLSLVGAGLGEGTAVWLIVTGDLAHDWLPAIVVFTGIGALGFVVVGARERRADWHYALPVGAAILAAAGWLAVTGSVPMAVVAAMFGGTIVLGPYYAQTGGWWSTPSW